jgi:hypothetical protein
MTESSTLLLNVPASRRAEAVRAWFSAQPDAGAAARELAEALAAMASVPHRVAGSNADTALIYFLEAEGMRSTLDEAAEAASEPRVAAQLWAHASTSALVLLELADFPYTYARRAVLADPGEAMAWEAYQSSLYGYSSGFFEDIEDWQRQAASGALPQELVTLAIAAAEGCAADWDEEDREMLALICGA